MRNLIDSSKCPRFKPTFDNHECSFYSYAEDDQMKIIHGECGFCKHPEQYRCMADITRTVPLSHSSTMDFCTCHYLYYLKKIMGIEVRPPFLSIPVKAGKLWDIVKQKHLGGDVSVKDTIEEYEIDPITVAKVRALYHAYKELEITVDEGGELQAKVNLTYNVSLPPTAFVPSVNVGKEAINLWRVRNEQDGDDRNWQFPLYVTGFYDRKYPTYFCEDKLSSRPENYLDPFFIQSQNGTYFLADPDLEYCIMEVVRFPQQKELKKNPETPDQMYKRVYDDVMSRPSKYFIGYDRGKRRYGKKFYRKEFDLDKVEKRYQQIIIETMAARWTGNFYPNWKACSNVFPGIPCEFQTICKTGVVSEEMFKIRGK